MESRDFYEVYSYGDRLKPGDELKIEHSVHFCRTRADLTDLTALSVSELEAMQKTSEKQEKAIFDKLCAATKEWEQQGANSLRIMKALEYVKTREVQHTSNVWKKSEHSYYEISNKVYKMSYRIYEGTAYNHHLKKSVPVSWEVSWWVTLNKPRNADFSSSLQIAGQDRKKYSDKAAMEKYLQGRKDAYAYLFTELSPPIPKANLGHFSLNGQLLPGYTVERECAEVVDELLELLADDDTIVPEPPPEKPVEQPAPKVPTKQKARKPPGRATPSR